jgi:hypothetical protein
MSWDVGGGGIENCSRQLPTNCSENSRRGALSLSLSLSLSHKSGLVSFFDFIVAANGVPLKTLDSTFIDLIKANENIPLPLTIYNYKNQTVRDVSVTPSRTWGGTGLLGVTIRFDSYFNATENLVRVLKVSPGGPAELAGLTPEVDYLLGTAERVRGRTRTRERLSCAESSD